MQSRLYPRSALGWRGWLASLTIAVVVVCSVALLPPHDVHVLEAITVVGGSIVCIALIVTVLIVSYRAAHRRPIIPAVSREVPYSMTAEVIRPPAIARPVYVLDPADYEEVDR